MMDMTTMSTGMMAGMGFVFLVILAFLVCGIAAFIKYLRA
jgi:Na+-transporting methylmalonyl-CoA/oxaloacetate decarboxylase gamma subunit